MSPRLSPEVVAMIRASTETGGALAKRLGIARQTVSKIRTGKTHQGNSNNDNDDAPAREEIVRQVLNQPPDLSLSQITELTGMDRETIRRIRLGLKHADVLPHLPRLTSEQMHRRCWNCVQWELGTGPGGADRWGKCQLGIPEATESQTWARGCGAYAPMEQQP